MTLWIGPQNIFVNGQLMTLFAFPQGQVCPGKSPRCLLDAGDDQRQQRVAGGETEDGTTRHGQPMRQAFPAGKRGTDGRLRASFVNGQLVTLLVYPSMSGI
jgi:hypothetical protein